MSPPADELPGTEVAEREEPALEPEREAKELETEAAIAEPRELTALAEPAGAAAEPEPEPTEAEAGAATAPTEPEDAGAAGGGTAAEERAAALPLPTRELVKEPRDERVGEEAEMPEPEPGFNAAEPPAEAMALCTEEATGRGLPEPAGCNEPTC